VTRPRAADDFTTIRARIEELRRERAQAFKKEPSGPDDLAPGGRNPLRGTEGRPRPEHESGSGGSSGRRYGSGR
jgi:hypothetical protein